VAGDAGKRRSVVPRESWGRFRHVDPPRSSQNQRVRRAGPAVRDRLCEATRTREGFPWTCGSPSCWCWRWAW
jgi:hypothetical protein